MTLPGAKSGTLRNLANLFVGGFYRQKQFGRRLIHPFCWVGGWCAGRQEVKQKAYPGRTTSSEYLEKLSKSTPAYSMEYNYRGA